MTPPHELPSVLGSPTRSGATNFPWPPGTLGACTALRGGRRALSRLWRMCAVILTVPVALVEFSSFPGTGRLLARWSPIGQLAYGRGVASSGFQYTSLAVAKVEIDWTETPHEVFLVSEGLLFAHLQVNGRDVFVDRRCGAALALLWGLQSDRGSAGDDADRPRAPTDRAGA